MSKINQNNTNPITNAQFNKRKHIQNKGNMPMGNTVQTMPIKMPISKPNRQKIMRNYQKYSSYQNRNQSYHNGSSYHNASSYRRQHLDYSKASQHNQIALQEHIIRLNERLKNLHEYYQQMLAQQRLKNKERSQVILCVVEQMQQNHKKKMQQTRQMINASEQQKKDVCFVDDKMTQIKSNIQYLISQSDILKNKNEELKAKIDLKAKQNKQKQKDLQQLNKQILECRGELQKFQINNIKNNKIKKEIIEMFNISFQ